MSDAMSTQVTEAVRDGESQRAAGRGEHEALRHELPDQSCAPRSKRQPRADLALPCAGAYDEQARDVRARHEENRTDDRHQEPQRSGELAPHGSQLVESQFVSGNFFRGLGVNTIIGRTLTDDDDRAGAPAVAVISHGFWQSAFGGDAQIIGRTIMVNGTSVTIVGVTFPSFFGVLPGSRPAVMLPLSLSVIDASTPPGTLARFGYWGFEAMGRLKPGETAPRAQAETEMLVRQAILAAPPASAYDPPRIVLDAGDRGLGDL